MPNCSRSVRLAVTIFVILVIGAWITAQKHVAQHPAATVREVNQVARPGPGTIILLGAMLVDGRGGPPVPDSAVVIRGERIVSVGPRASVAVPPGAEKIDAGGMTVLPGLVDAHFHLDGDTGLPSLFLSHGVTSVRDPGQWIEAYDEARRWKDPPPRLFLTGPHLDTSPPAYPEDSIIVRDPEEARLAVNRFVDQGASAIKVYFRLPLETIRTATATAHGRGIPVTAHLEIVDARDAINAGVDGIEHITSFGTALIPPRDAEKYRQAVLADNNARRDGRYRMWNTIDLHSSRLPALLDLVVRRGTFLSPTLAIFERRAGDRDATDMHVKGFAKMMQFVGLARKAGARIVVGSHSSVPHAERGWAYQRELELLVESGLTPMQALVSATSENARFFRIEGRLGTIEAGKLADLVLVQGDPLHNISAMRNVKRVMLNGVWVAQ
ncbi:MAG TPA: amidohydrolase family protein [Acidobacteriota bacterium]|jgi:imidazolonepropionase-like amidohydrolase